MLKVMLALVFAAASLPADDKDDVSAAAKKSTEAKSYAFKGESKTESTGNFGGGGGGGQPQASKFEGKFEKEVGQTILTDQNEYVKIGKITATRPLAQWRVIEENPEGGGGGRGGRGMGGFGRRGAPKAPHEELADFGAKIAKCKKLDATDNDCTVYEGELTAEAAKEFNPMSRMLDRMGGGEVTGKAKLWVKDGAVVKYEITTKIEADIQGNAFEMTQTKTVAISGVDETKVEIPEGAKAAIEKKKKEDY